MCVRVRMCVRLLVRARACACACVRECVRVRACARARAAFAVRALCFAARSSALGGTICPFGPSCDKSSKKTYLKEHMR
eukprot:4345827-Pleurochrysis_carterae.AAC.1